ncbi:YSC84-related protein [Maribacter sp. 1_MG-2023]|uniref:lipid-binding SYLF domain-containing protein n=1 Tax=Maribacter sp. 1_MG-2023 TaxID=3062677 RepID=UPI0026E3ABE2|nr:YSC84-related protein [Maribacter sp. 1_MG-2023]MDO6473743.1 YSC84-related protein [Maribacter sp. 1_MG-2023]
MITLIKKSQIVLFLIGLAISHVGSAQIGGWNPALQEDSEKAMIKMLEESPKLEKFVNEAYGYAVFPKITKAGLGVGGAAGNGIVYKEAKIVGSSKLKQASFGLQAGGQQYSEVIFFENKESFKKFTNGKLKLDAQASAVVITKGASIDVAYQNGVAVFTFIKGGLMYEASVGGQHFKFKSKE